MRSEYDFTHARRRYSAPELVGCTSCDGDAVTQVGGRLQEIIGTRVQALRDAVNLDRDTFADYLNHPRNSIEAIEDGRTSVEVHVLAAIARVLGCEPWHLLCDSHCIVCGEPLRLTEPKVPVDETFADVAARVHDQLHQADDKQAKKKPAKKKTTGGAATFADVVAKFGADKVLSASGVATLCGVSHQTPRNWKTRDDGPPWYECAKDGARSPTFYYLRTEVQAWWKANKARINKNVNRPKPAAPAAPAAPADVPDELSSAQVADLTGRTPKAIENLRTKGKGPHFFRRGRTVRYKRDDVLRWLAEVDFSGSPRATKAAKKKASAKKAGKKGRAAKPVRAAVGDVLLTYEQAAAITGKGVDTLRLWRFNGRGPDFVTVTDERGKKRTRYREVDLRRWMQEQEAAHDDACQSTTTTVRKRDKQQGQVHQLHQLNAPTVLVRDDVTPLPPLADQLKQWQAQHRTEGFDSFEFKGDQLRAQVHGKLVARYLRDIDRRLATIDRELLHDCRIIDGGRALDWPRLPLTIGVDEFLQAGRRAVAGRFVTVDA